MIEGYTELIKIAENGLKGNPEKVKSYMELFIKKFPNHDLIKPFKSIINNDPRTLMLCCDNNIMTMKEYFKKHKKLLDKLQLEQPITENHCAECGHKMTLVRPGKYQCDNPKCKSNK